jgi:multiple sugar transport system substrate-binding protein
VAAWEQVTEAWNAVSTEAPARLLPDRTRATLLADIERGQVPDIFLAPRSMLGELRERELLRPVDELLDERGVDFGDGYSRDALQSFSADNALQCMPYGISPTVMFLNTDLVDFERMAARGLPLPSSPTQWFFSEFAAAARFATRPRRGIRGVHVAPTLQGLAPWVLAGGGQLFDDNARPSSLALSSDESVAALETLLQLLRSPQVTPTQEQLERTTPLQLFEDGRLAMMPGDRSLVPRLREVSGLSFDVRQMPRLEGDATTGAVTGLCLSADADPASAADFLVHLIKPASVGTITEEGFLVPANLEVALSPTFLQPERQPAHPEVFLDTIRDIAMLPEVDYAALHDLLEPQLDSLFYDPLIELGDLTAVIDELSQTILGLESLEEGEEGEEGEQDPAEDQVVPTPMESPGQ